MIKRVDLNQPGNVDEYIGGFVDEETRDFLRTLRDLCLANAPGAGEGLKWGSPAYFRDTILFMFSGFEQHAKVTFTPSTKEAFATRLADFETGEGSVGLPYDRDIPADLLAEMMTYRFRWWEVDGITWT